MSDRLTDERLAYEAEIATLTKALDLRIDLHRKEVADLQRDLAASEQQVVDPNPLIAAAVLATRAECVAAIRNSPDGISSREQAIAAIKALAEETNQ